MTIAASRTPAGAVLLGLSCLAGAAGAEDFWRHWGDGQAEMNGYRLTQPRYASPRDGTAALIFVTEDFSDRLRVKADPGKHPAGDVYPVMKLNAIREFQTGIYDYNVMTSTFARVAPGWPIAKVSFSSQEWCGHVYHQLLPRPSGIEGVVHSYFDGEADATERLALPDGGVFEDALPILLRRWNGELAARGETRRVPFLRSLLWARLEHRKLAWESASIARSQATARVAVPFGEFEADTWTVTAGDGATLVYQIESEPPYRLLRWSSSSGEEAVLLGSARLAYWKLNGPGGESRLEQMGLPVPGKRQP